ncbi:sensor histidine kinase [Mycobacterium sp. NPDC048908]|uniref:sensor histidine kinase n=1 Tax=Mycobacterium sp. NPDC048908 TaxID=3364292 RepID=UPI0037178AB4
MMGSRHGIGLRLLVTNLLVVVAGMAMTTVVAMTVGPPMIRRLMDQAIVPGLNGVHPYERAFREATMLSVGIALTVSALATLSLSYYLSRRVHRSATALSRAASAVANRRYDVAVPTPGLGREFDTVAAAFNTMAQRLGAAEETRRQMLADLAHEIRTPVSVLEAYMEALEDGVQPLDAETIATLRAQTRRLTRFSVDVTSLAVAERRTTFIDAGWTSPAELISSAVSAFAPRYSAKGVELRSQTTAELPKLWADPERLAQVLSNLLDNALRHTCSGDEVSVVTFDNNDELVIAVSDTGDGVAPEHLSRLFDRFYRADSARDRRQGGAGIGLSIAKALVEGHGGHIEAHSEGLGTGCTISIRLPYRQGESADAESTEAVEHRPVTTHYVRKVCDVHPC